MLSKREYELLSKYKYPYYSDLNEDVQSHFEQLGYIEMCDLDVSNPSMIGFAASYKITNVGRYALLDYEEHLFNEKQKEAEETKRYSASMKLSILSLIISFLALIKDFFG